MTIPVALIPGAGGAAWYWHLVEPELHARGYDAFAVEFPAADESKHLTDYADAVVAAVGERGTVALVAQSMGGFTAPLVWQRIPVAAVVLVNAMIPNPGETPGAWWGNVGSVEARTAAAHASGYSPDFDLDTYFLHDIPSELAAVMRATDKPQADAPFGDVCEFDAWPDVPIHVITGRDDRFFPLELQQRVARARLGVDPEVVAGGHLAALSRPAELAAAIARCLTRSAV